MELSNKNSNNNDTILCLYCDKAFSNNIDQENHEERDHKTILNKGKGSRKSERITKNNSSSENSAFPGCFHCNKKVSRTDDLDSLFQHLLTSHKDVYYGCKCKLRTQDKVSLVNHKKNCKIGGGSKSSRSVDENVTDNRKFVKKSQIVRNNGNSKYDYSSDSEDISIASASANIINKALPTNAIQKKADRSKLKPNSKIASVNDKGKKSKGSGSSTASSSSSREEEYTIPLTRQKIKEPPTLPRLNATQNRSSSNKKSQKTNKVSTVDSKAITNSSPIAKVLRTKTNKLTTANSLNNSEQVENVPKTDLVNIEFDEDFYKNISNNIRTNLSHYVDGKNDRLNIRRVFDHISEQSTSEDKKEIQKGHDKEIHEATNYELSTPFPALLTAEQYGFGDSIHNKNKRHITKNSWKWKWDLIKKYKYVNEGGKIVKKVKQITTGLKDLSQLDMWTQLSMRSRYENLNNQSGVTFDDGLNDSLSTRMIKTQNIEQLNYILDKCLTPEIDIEQLQQTVIKAEPEEVDEIIEDLGMKNKSLEDFSNSEMFSIFNLEKVNCHNTVKPTLSGEWARPRCFICVDCGQEFDLMKSLNDHKNSEHPYVVSAHYEIVGRENLEKKLYKNLFLPKKALQTNGFARSLSINSDSKSNETNEASTSSDNSSKFFVDQKEKECSKCLKMIKYSSDNDIYRHMLDCIEDRVWLQAKRRNKYRRSRRKNRKAGRKSRLSVDQKKSTSSPSTKDNTEGENSTLSLSNPPTPINENKSLPQVNSKFNKFETLITENKQANGKSTDGLNIKNFFRVSKTTPVVKQNVVVQMLEIPQNEKKSLRSSLRSSTAKKSTNNDSPKNCVSSKSNDNKSVEDSNDAKNFVSEKSSEEHAEQVIDEDKNKSQQMIPEAENASPLIPLIINTPEKNTSDLQLSSPSSSSLISPTSNSTVPKKKKKLNDCIAMLTCKIQEKLGVNFFENSKNHDKSPENISELEKTLKLETKPLATQKNSSENGNFCIRSEADVEPSSTSVRSSLNIPLESQIDKPLECLGTHLQPLKSPHAENFAKSSESVESQPPVNTFQPVNLVCAINLSTPSIYSAAISPRTASMIPNRGDEIKISESKPSTSFQIDSLLKETTFASPVQDEVIDLSIKKNSPHEKHEPQTQPERKNHFTKESPICTVEEGSQTEFVKSSKIGRSSQRKSARKGNTTQDDSQRCSAEVRAEESETPQISQISKENCETASLEKGAHTDSEFKSEEQVVETNVEEGTLNTNPNNKISEEQESILPTEDLNFPNIASNNTDSNVLSEKNDPQDEGVAKNLNKIEVTQLASDDVHHYEMDSFKISIPKIKIPNLKEILDQHQVITVNNLKISEEERRAFEEQKNRILQILNKTNSLTRKITCGKKAPKKTVKPKPFAKRRPLLRNAKKSDVNLRPEPVKPKTEPVKPKPDKSTKKAVPQNVEKIETKIEDAIKTTNRIRCRRLSVVVDPIINLSAFQTNRKIRLTNNSQQNGFYDILAASEQLFSDNRLKTENTETSSSQNKSKMITGNKSTIEETEENKSIDEAIQKSKTRKIVMRKDIKNISDNTEEKQLENSKNDVTNESTRNKKKKAKAPTGEICMTSNDTACEASSTDAQESSNNEKVATEMVISAEGAKVQEDNTEEKVQPSITAKKSKAKKSENISSKTLISSEDHTTKKSLRRKASAPKDSVNTNSKTDIAPLEKKLVEEKVPLAENTRVKSLQKKKSTKEAVAETSEKPLTDTSFSSDTSNENDIPLAKLVALSTAQDNSRENSSNLTSSMKATDTGAEDLKLKPAKKAHSIARKSQRKALKKTQKINVKSLEEASDSAFAKNGSSEKTTSQNDLQKESVQENEESFSETYIERNENSHKENTDVSSDKISGVSKEETAENELKKAHESYEKAPMRSKPKRKTASKASKKAPARTPKKALHDEALTASSQNDKVSKEISDEKQEMDDVLDTIPLTPTDQATVEENHAEIEESLKNAESPAKELDETPQQLKDNAFTDLHSISEIDDKKNFDSFTINEDSFFNDDLDNDPSDKINDIVNNIINSSELQIDSDTEKGEIFQHNFDDQSNDKQQNMPSCVVCKRTFRNEKVYDKHCKTSTHIMKVKRKHRGIAKLKEREDQKTPVEAEFKANLTTSPTFDDSKMFRTKGALKTFELSSDLKSCENETTEVLEERSSIICAESKSVELNREKMLQENDDKLYYEYKMEKKPEEMTSKDKDRLFDSLFSSLEVKSQDKPDHTSVSSPKCDFVVITPQDSEVETSSTSWDLKHDAGIEWEGDNDHAQFANVIKEKFPKKNPIKVNKTKDTAISIPTKSLIMGKIFKKHRDREKQKTPQADAPNNKPGIKNSLDEIFDHLKNSAEIDDKVLTCPSPKTLLKNGGTFSPNSSNSNDMLETASQANNNNIYKNREPRANLEQDYQKTKDCSSADLELINALISEDCDDGIGKRKSRRRCAIKAKTFAETWSSDEYEELHDTEDIISIINEIEKRESTKKRKLSKSEEPARKIEPVVNPEKIDNSTKSSSAVNSTELECEKKILQNVDNRAREKSEKKKTPQIPFSKHEKNSNSLKKRKISTAKDGHKSDEETFTATKDFKPLKLDCSIKKRRMSCFVPSTTSFNEKPKSKVLPVKSFHAEPEPQKKFEKINENLDLKSKSTNVKKADSEKSFKNQKKFASLMSNFGGQSSSKKKVQKHRKRPRNKVKNIAYDSDSDFELNINKKSKASAISESSSSDEEEEEENHDVVSLPKPTKSQAVAYRSTNTNDMTMIKEPKLLPNDLKHVAPSATTFKAAIPEDDASQSTCNRTKRHSSEKLYYWSSSSSESEQEHGDTADGDNEDSVMPHQPEQHGWIVGDSHKKLVTLLAHAKIKNKIN